MPALWPLPEDPLAAELKASAEQLRLGARYAELDRDPAFPREEFRALGRARWLGLTVPETHGGRGLPLRRAATLLFHLAYVGGTTFAKLAMQPEFGSVLRTRGTPEQRTEWFEPMVRGERLVGNQITEPGAGSDVRALGLTAKRTSDGYELNGTKSEAAFAADADAALVYARLGGADGPVTAFLVPQTLAGVRRHVDPADMGERWQRRGHVTYAEVRLPLGARVGAEGDGFAPLLDELVQDRGLLAAIYLGVGRAALDGAIRYVSERRAFGRRLAENQGLAFPLVNAATRLRAAWLLTLDALEQFEASRVASAATAMAKVAATESALEAIDLAIQCHGGSGYSSRLLHEQRYRDVRSGAIAHGTNEVLRQTAARALWPPSGPES